MVWMANLNKNSAEVDIASALGEITAACNVDHQTNWDMVHA